MIVGVREMFHTDVRLQTIFVCKLPPTTLDDSFYSTFQSHLLSEKEHDIQKVQTIQSLLKNPFTQGWIGVWWVLFVEEEPEP